MHTSLPRRRFLQSTLALGCSLGAFPAAYAQSTPAEGRVVFGYLPNSTTGTLVTTVLDELHPLYRPTLPNKLTYIPGNSGALAMDAVAKAPADGATVLLAPSSSFTLLPQLRRLDNVDPARDFVPVAAFGEFAFAFVIGQGVPERVKTMNDYLDWVKANPMAANYGVPGLGTGAHFVGVELSQRSGVLLKPIAYRGIRAQVEDLVMGSLPAAIVVLANARNEVPGVPLRLLAVTSEKRWLTAPELPTLIELNLAETPVVESYGFFMSSRTPESKVHELAEALDVVEQSPAVRAALVAATMRPTPTTSLTYALSLGRERGRWQALVKSHNFSLDS